MSAACQWKFHCLLRQIGVFKLAPCIDINIITAQQADRRTIGETSRSKFLLHPRSTVHKKAPLHDFCLAMIKRSLFAEPSDLTHKKKPLITNRVCPEVEVLMISHKHSAQFCLHASSVSHVCPSTVEIIPSWRTRRVFWTLFVVSVEEKSPLPGKMMHPLLRHANTDLDQSLMVLLDSLPTEPHQQTHIKRKSLNPFMSIYGGLGVGLTYIEEICCHSSR